MPSSRTSCCKMSNSSLFLQWPETIHFTKSKFWGWLLTSRTTACFWNAYKQRLSFTVLMNEKQSQIFVTYTSKGNSNSKFQRSQSLKGASTVFFISYCQGPIWYKQPQNSVLRTSSLHKPRNMSWMQYSAFRHFVIPEKTIILPEV